MGKNQKFLGQSSELFILRQKTDISSMSINVPTGEQTLGLSEIVSNLAETTNIRCKLLSQS